MEERGVPSEPGKKDGGRTVWSGEGKRGAGQPDGLLGQGGEFQRNG